MARITVPDGCYSVRMADGTKYPVKNGHAELSAKHTAQMKTSAARQNLDMIMESAPVPQNRPDHWCSECLMNNVAWISKCTRCGAALEKVT